MIKHLYIHWPFCRKKCSYCDFASFPNKNNDLIKKYHTALCNEIKHTTFDGQQSSEKNSKPSISTIFFGGGTPSIYPIPLLEELFSLLNEKFCLKNLEEATIEANPASTTEEKLAAWKSFGINRLSAGVQILDEKILESVNRFQKNSDVINFLEIAPKYFENISVDLILGLPGTTSKIWFDTLDYLTSKPIKHMSVYFLTLYEKTPLYRQIKDKMLSLPSEDWLVSTYEKTISYLENQGNTPNKSFFQYEISNFSKPGYNSLHNKAYWDRKPYRGFGLSAASFLGENKRLVNSKNLLEYVDYWSKRPFSANDRSAGQLDQGKPCYEEEILTADQVFLEKLMLGLRQKAGINLHDVVYFLEVSPPKRYHLPRRSESLEPLLQKKRLVLEKKIEDLEKRGFISKKNGRISLTTRGMILENEIILSLL